MTNTQELKNDIRKKIFGKRKLAHNAREATEADQLSSFLEHFQGLPMAGYMPIRTEIDPLPSMAKISFYGKWNDSSYVGSSFRFWNSARPKTLYD